MADINFEFTDNRYDLPLWPSNYVFDFGGDLYYYFIPIQSPPSPVPILFNFNFLFRSLAPTSYDFNFGLFTYKVFSEPANILAICVSSAANINFGKVYAASADKFIVIDLESKTIIDYYTTTHSGSRRKVLKSDDIVDIFIQGV